MRFFDFNSLASHPQLKLPTRNLIQLRPWSSLAELTYPNHPSRNRSSSHAISPLPLPYCITFPDYPQPHFRTYLYSVIEFTASYILPRPRVRLSFCSWFNCSFSFIRLFFVDCFVTCYSSFFIHWLLSIFMFYNGFDEKKGPGFEEEICDSQWIGECAILFYSNFDSRVMYAPPFFVKVLKFRLRRRRSVLGPWAFTWFHVKLMSAYF